MKKLLIASIALFIFGCSSDDDSTEPVNNNPECDLTASMADVCEGPEVAFYCISEQTYNDLLHQMIEANGGCVYAEFTDLDGEAHEGWLAGLGGNPND